MATQFENYLASMGLTLQDLSPSAYSDFSQQFNLYGPTESGIRSGPTSMLSLTDAVPLSQQLGITFNNLPPDSPMRTDTRIVPEEYGLEPRDYGLSEEMVSDTTSGKGILQNIDFGKLLSFAEILGPTNLRKALAGTRLGSTVNNLFQGGRDGLGLRSDFLNRTPGYTGTLLASDQYDPITKTNRFDRAKTLFGQSRSLKEYFEKKKALANAKRLGRPPTAPSRDDSGDGGGGGQKDSGGPTGGYTYDSGGRQGFGYGL
tara:strand:+ start:622 stop:1398 length:777 start_codon:yes stop_codon:yes gene_type:complete